MVQKLTFKQQMEGFPWTQLLVVSLVRFSEPIAFTSLFPYVYFMVRDFHIAPTNAEVSKYSGYLSSSFALCQVISAYHWGHFSDLYGRKWALTLGLIGTSSSLMVLGFASNFYMALLARSMMGLLNGNVGVLRTMIGEIATERKHQALAFSTMPLLFQFGSVVGPMIGGFLVFKRSHGEVIPGWLPKWLRGLVHAYPYLLPNLVVSIFLLVGLINATLFLEETHPVYKYRRDYGVELGDFVKEHLLGMQKVVRPWQVGNRETLPPGGSITNEATNLNSNSSANSDAATAESLEYEATPLLPSCSSASSSQDSIQSWSPILSRRQSVGLIREYSLHEPTDMPDPGLELASDGCQENSTYHHVFHTSVFYPISVNFIMSLHLIVYNEFLPVFLAYDLAQDDEGRLESKFPWKISGGIGYLPDQTGALLSSTGIFGCFVVIFIFPVVDRNFDCLTIFRSLVLLYPIMYLMVPYVVFLQKDGIPRWCTIVYLYFITGTKTLCGALTSPQIMLIIHNCSPLSCRAVINGATISISAAARFVGPLIWGYIMSWSQEYDIAWVSWWSLGLISMVALYQSYKIDPIDGDETGQDRVEEVRPRHQNSLSRMNNRRSSANSNTRV
ncbi:ZYBA0S06-03532g1_1 [Zygosaccharomyces bailii CLIB 213]|uniref:ZYBA0S06-03532g1_1 n=1 Tax=Zygosaccharomyces bailii (strain CLIB 213 / ATCC 58445 / CBS 680 / BCRC 21525 / NBRC 1098 / NCYC 1416 / NRRL Y-2227) TaxID=1333698 RepID=A0A8J2T795_ZYGB2|nr:ZYBA0S06-03532g1_1 [Zygosaccharomyces bailii CLIB 213]